MIQYLKYKNRPAVSIESDMLRAIFLPDDGGKMASLSRISDGKELLTTKPGSLYRELTYDGEYISSECSGFDDMFPTVDPYTPSEGAYMGITYPDHGETCRLSYSLNTENEAILLRSVSRLFPIAYEKRVSAQENSIFLCYRIENLGDVPFDFLWAGHIMLQGEDDMEIITPFDENTPTEMMFAPNDIDPAALPKNKLTGFIPQTGSTHKFYYTEPMKQGKFGVRYSDGSSLLFEVDEKRIPYLGIWLNNGAFQDIYTVTPEPCTVPFDSPGRSAKRGFTSVIPPQDVFSFEIKITVKDKHNESYNSLRT